jgi:hypothetical protein
MKVGLGIRSGVGVYCRIVLAGIPIHTHISNSHGIMYSFFHYAAKLLQVLIWNSVYCSATEAAQDMILGLQL